MKFSLIVTGFDRHEALDRFFASILASTVHQVDVEIIFVNQGHYKSPVERLLAKGVSLTEVAAGRLGLSKARNLGIKHAKGEIFGFPDDDCWYGNNFLEGVAGFFSRNQTTDALCCNVFDPDRCLPYANLPVGHTESVSYSNLFRLPISVGIFVRRRAFVKAGLYFDEGLGAGTYFGSGEETEFVSRLLEVRARIQYDGTLQVFHPVPDYKLGDVKKFFHYALGFGYLNGRFVRRGQLGVLGNFIAIVLRSIGGAIIRAHRPVEREVYWNRFRGAVVGFIMGFRGVPTEND